MSKHLTTFDKIQRSLFSDAEKTQIKLTAAQEVVKIRYMKGYSYWAANPSYTDKQLVRFLINNCNVNRSQAYHDVQLIKRMLGNIRVASRAWQLYCVIELCKESYQVAKLTGDSKGMTLAADKIGKYSQLDKPEMDQLPWDELVPPNFEPSPDIAILGFKRDPDIEEKRKAMRAKYLAKYDPGFVSDAEIVED